MKKKKSKEKLPIERISADFNIGLSEKQVLERVEKGYSNKQPKRLSKSYARIIRTNLFTLFNLINLVLGVLVLVYGSPRNALFLGIVTINIVIGIIQEIRSKVTVEKLSLLSQPKVTVIRDSVEQTISIEEIVVDDILVLKAGNQIPTDCHIVYGLVNVNESLLTGEQDTIKKQEKALLYSGSFIVSGNCKARVEFVGEDNYASKIVSNAKKYKKPNSELMTSIQWIIRTVTLLILIVGPLMFWNNSKPELGLTTGEVVEKTVASIVGMIPEGLVLLTSLALAVGVIKLAKKRTLVQELYCIETLARVDMLCLDKTGTITEGTMQVEKTIMVQQSEQSLDDIIGNITLSLNDNNATFEALKDKFKPSCNYIVSKTMPFASDKKMSAVSFQNYGTYVIGAPEFVLKNRISEVKEIVDENAALGFRVLVLVKTDEEINEEKTFNEEKMQIISLIIISDKIRESAENTLAYFAKQGVGIKIISGDNPITVSKIAQRVKLKNADKYVNAQELDNEEKIYDAVKKYTIFGRVTPIQKKQIVQALKSQGYTVGMTGDGVNDVMALKESDCSIAMASGSDAARHTSQLVLLDSDFSALPDVVAEGRRVVNNINRAASLFLVKTTYSIVLSLLLVLLEIPYPFKPIQMSLISTLLIGIPSGFLAIEPNNRKITGRFLNKVVKNAVPAGITISIFIVLAHFLAPELNSEQMSTLCVYIYALVQFFVLFNTCKPYDVKRVVLFAFCTVAFFITIWVIPDFFFLVDIPQKTLLVMAVFIISLYPVMKLIEMILSFCFKAYKYSLFSHIKFRLLRRIIHGKD